MNRMHSRDFVRNPPIPKRSVIYCVAATLLTFTAIFHSLAYSFEALVIVSFAGLSFFFWASAALVWRKERLNEGKQLDEFLRDPLVSDKYVFHYFVAMSIILTISAAIVFYVQWSFGLITTFPAAVFGYLAYISWRKRMNNIAHDD